MTLRRPLEIFNMDIIDNFAKSNKHKIERPMTMGFHYKSRRNLGSALPEPKDSGTPEKKKIQIYIILTIYFFMIKIFPITNLQIFMKVHQLKSIIYHLKRLNIIISGKNLMIQ